jgi:hypothetical protein
MLDGGCAAPSLPAEMTIAWPYVAWRRVSSAASGGAKNHSSLGQ